MTKFNLATRSKCALTYYLTGVGRWRLPTLRRRRVSVPY